MVSLRHDATLDPKERRSRGAYYTSPELARKIVERALEPHLCSADTVEALRICDPAMGDGVFLVEALRCLAPLLAKAWEMIGKAGNELAARRCIADHILFGVDNDPGAVESARAAVAKEIERPAVAAHFALGDALVGRYPGPYCGEFEWWPDMTLGGTVLPHDWAGFLPITCWVGNPPFLGGGKISGTLGVEYPKYLRWAHEDGYHGNADMCAHFFRRANMLTSAKRKATISFIATNTIAQGDTRACGIQYLVRDGWKICDAEKSFTWPGDASVHVSIVHLRYGFDELSK